MTAGRKILVTGATGFTGGHLTRRLASDGCHVRGLIRDADRREELRSRGVEAAVGDLRNPESLRRAVRDVDVVYHIAALYRPENVPRERFFEVNAAGTRQLLEAAEAEGVARFVHCSTVGVHGEIENPPADEDTPIDPADHYQASKAEGERIARIFADEGRLPVTIFRPAAIYGPGDTRFLKLFRAIGRGRFVMLGSGETLYHLIYIDDLIDGILQCGRCPEAVGRVYILAGPGAVSINELADTIADELDADIPEWHLPLAPVQAVAVLCEAVCRPLGIQPPLFRRRMDFFRKDRAFDTARAREELGFTPRIGVAEGVRRTAEWYREQGLLG